MRLRTRLLVQIGLALVLTNNLAHGYAAEAHMYRCVNSKGRVYYSDRPGTQCVDGTHDRLTRHGLLLDRPVDEAAARPGETTKEHRRRLARERYDRMLRASYTSEEEIEAAKQRSLQSPILAVKWGIKKINIYRGRLDELEQHEATLTDSSVPVPDSLKKDIETAKSDVTRVERELESKQSRVDRIASRFEADKDRYRELSARTRIK